VEAAPPPYPPYLSGKIKHTMTAPPPHQQTPASQALEDLACASWTSEVLFAALELDLFHHLDPGPLPLAALAREARCLPGPLGRLLPALARLGLIEAGPEGWRNLPVVRRHLLPGGAEYLGDFLLYRRYLQPPWQGLAGRVSDRPLAPGLSREDDYPTRNRHYVRALDQLARVKAREIAALLASTPWRGPILDLGGGAGSLSRALLRQQPTSATLFELPEVLLTAKEIYPEPATWVGMATVAGDFRDHPFAETERFGLILLANVLHTYDPTEARICLKKATALLSPGGHLLIHDYCPDRTAPKGQLYDLLMLLNTPGGVCHEAGTLQAWLSDCGLLQLQVMDLPSDSSLIVGQRPPC